MKIKPNRKIKSKSDKKLQRIAMFIFSFRLMNLTTKLYVRFGTSFKSEKEAYLKVMELAKSAGIRSIRRDRYYAAQKSSLNSLGMVWEEYCLFHSKEKRHHSGNTGMEKMLPTLSTIPKFSKGIFQEEPIGE